MLPYFKKLLGIESSKVDLPQELVHINQEMYKKSVELSDKNKTLLLLRKIDEIILSAITDPHQIAENVASLLVKEANFQIASIYMYEEEELMRLAIARNIKQKEYNDDNINYFYLSTIDFNSISNLVSQSINYRHVKSSNTIQNAILTKEAEVDTLKIQEAYGIKSIWAYPMIVRDQLAGALVVCLSEEEQDLSENTLDLLNRLAQVIGIAIDNSRLYNELQDANKKLKELDKLKDEFVSLASHELRTPMTAIKSYIWMTINGDARLINEKQKLYLQRAYASVDRLIKLVNDMLNISRIESGRLTVTMQRVDMVKLTQDVLNEVLPRAKEVGVNIILTPASSLPEVIADPDKIKEVIFNLIGNSLKFTPKDGNITISFEQKGEFIETKIKDTGAGISSENIDKLFQKFSMVADSYKMNQSASGTGLGLYISRSIIEIHKGKIWVTSEGLGKGSEFIFSLKIANETDFQKYNSSNLSEKGKTVDIVHTQL